MAQFNENTNVNIFNLPVVRPLVPQFSQSSYQDPAQMVGWCYHPLLSQAEDQNHCRTGCHWSAQNLQIPIHGRVTNNCHWTACRYHIPNRDKLTHHNIQKLYLHRVYEVAAKLPFQVVTNQIWKLFLTSHHLFFEVQFTSELWHNT